MDLLYSLTAATAPSRASSPSRASLEHHNDVLRTHPVASTTTTSRRDSPCVWQECAVRICSAASVRPPLQVGPAVARGRHWSTTMTSSGPTLSQARPRNRGETLRASGRSVRDGSVVQPQCGHRSKSGQHRSRASLEHHDDILRTHPVACSTTTLRRDSPCVWQKCARRICSAASVRPRLQVGPADACGRY